MTDFLMMLFCVAAGAFVSWAITWTFWYEDKRRIRFRDEWISDLQDTCDERMEEIIECKKQIRQLREDYHAGLQFVWEFDDFRGEFNRLVEIREGLRPKGEVEPEEAPF